MFLTAKMIVYTILGFFLGMLGSLRSSGLRQSLGGSGHQNTRSCAGAFVIPELNLEKILPSTGTTALNIPSQPPRLGYTLQSA